MKIFTIFLFLLLLGVISCNNIFGDGSAKSPSAGAYGPSGGVITQDDYDRVGDPGYERETEYDLTEIASTRNVLLNYHLKGENRLGALSEYNSITSLFDDLDDQFSTYYDPTQAAILFEEFSTPNEGGAFGFSTRFENDTLKINYVFPGSPADREGIMRGDILFEVNGKPLLTDDNALSLFYTEIEGGVGTTSTIKILRENTFITTSLTKENIRFATAWKDSLTPYSSLIQITGFEVSTLDDSQEIYTTRGEQDTAVGTHKEFREALRQSKDDLVTVIDLRGNPGGFVSICTSMIDELISDGVFFITTRIDQGTIFHDTISANPGGIAHQRDFILLADANSASCSELFIQGVRTNQEAPLIGQTTYGKGIAQGFKPTERGGVVRTTGTQYYYEDGSSYNEKGHQPDYEIESPTAQLVKAIELANDMAGVGSGGSANGKEFAEFVSHLQFTLDQRPRSHKNPTALILDKPIQRTYE